MQIIGLTRPHLLDKAGMTLKMGILMDRKETITLEEYNEAIATKKPLAMPPVQIVQGVQWRKPVLFSIPKSLTGPIMRQHMLGQFYETKELLALRPHFPKWGVFVDIGANAGNHSIFAALHLKPNQIIPVEPNPVAYSTLLTDIILNKVSHLFDLRFLGVGAADKRNGGYAMSEPEKNLGAAKMLPGEGDIEVMSGDEMLEGVKPDLIKIDVEGMELEVLKGLSKTITTHKPAILIEVDNVNEDKFLKQLKQLKYRVETTFVRYKTNKNFLVLPQ